mmetsp:Transcript_3368/g.7688  ORF Transcript_3368/g.7688 Transcript_3368/m.7688 type:complete len:120 (-) Transcript_3368:155-514(-)
MGLAAWDGLLRSWTNQDRRVPTNDDAILFLPRTDAIGAVIRFRNARHAHDAGNNNWKQNHSAGMLNFPPIDGLNREFCCDGTSHRSIFHCTSALLMLAVPRKTISSEHRECFGEGPTMP